MLQTRWYYLGGRRWRRKGTLWGSWGTHGDKRRIFGKPSPLLLLIPGSGLLLQNSLFMYPPVISEVQWIMIQQMLCWVPGFVISSWIVSQPSQQDPPPCPLSTCTSPKYKPWVHKFHLSFYFTSLWPFCFTQYFPGGLFSFSSWNYSGKTGKRSEVWIFWWGHLNSRNCPLENSLKGGLQEKKDTNVCIEASFLQEDFLASPSPWPSVSSGSWIPKEWSCSWIKSVPAEFHPWLQLN